MVCVEKRIHLLMWGHGDGVVATVEDDELRLEHDVAIDLERGGRGLDTAEASWKVLVLIFDISFLMM
jgi:hypothetical protein